MKFIILLLISCGIIPSCTKPGDFPAPLTDIKCILGMYGPSKQGPFNDTSFYWHNVSGAMLEQYKAVKEPFITCGVWTKVYIVGPCENSN